MDRSAETAIFNVLAENPKAHRRRHGEEGAVYNTPVPDYDEKSANFHCCSPQQIELGDFKEKFSLKKVKIMAQKRELNDYCPRVQLQKLIDDCGKPELSYDTITHEDGSATVTPVDSNETMKKVLDKVDHFVDEFVEK